MEKLLKNSKAEALDEDGVWCTSTVVSKESEAVTVTFDGWGEEWNRRVDNSREIREVSVVPSARRKPIATNFSRKVRLNTLFTF